MACQQTREVTYRTVEEAVVLCRTCGAIVPVTPWLRRRDRHDPKVPIITSFLGLPQLVPEHEPRIRKVA